MSQGSSESIVEDAALDWLTSLGYTVLHGPNIAAGETTAERSDPNYRDVVLEGPLRQALVRLNPDLPANALEDAYRRLREPMRRSCWIAIASCTGCWWMA